MDNYIIELFGGTAIEITREDYQALMGKTGLVFLKSLNRTINTAGIKQIVDKKTYEIDKHMERQQTQEGVLHDGKRVIKHFGVWYLADGDYDERGNPLSRPYEGWYPEVARDCIPTVQEYALKYAALPKPERLKLMMGNYDSVQEPRRIGGTSLQGKRI